MQSAAAIAVDERQRLVTSLKSDNSIVTNADKAVEEYLRKKLAQLVPNTGIWGEEYGIEPPGENGLWLIDPVDGTSNFAYGSPLWGVTAALLQGEEIVLGAVLLADLDETYLAAKGNGVTKNGETVQPIPPGPVLRHELVGCCDANARILTDHIPGKLRCNGAFVVEGAFVATQRMRGMIGGGERLYDAASCILFGQELGADVRYVDGKPLDLRANALGAKFDRPWIIFPADSGFFVGAR